MGKAGAMWTTLGVVLALLPPSPLAQRAASGRQQSWKNGFNFLDRVEKKTAGLKRLEPRGWELTPKFQGIMLTPQESKRFSRRFWGDFTFSFKASFRPESAPSLPVSLLSVHSPKRALPLMDLQIAGKGGIVVRYMGEKSFQRVRLNKGLSDWSWHSLVVKMNSTAVSVRVDCGSEVVVKLRQRPGQLNMASRVWLGRPADGLGRLQGILFEASLYPRNLRTEGLCDEGLAADQPVGHQGNTGSASLLDRFTALEQQLARVSSIVDSLSVENADLKQRIAYRETCECRPRCAYNGQVYTEGDTWTQGMCAICQCLGGQPVCSARDDVPSCVEQCQGGGCPDDSCSPVVDVTLPGQPCAPPSCLGPVQVLEPGPRGQRCLVPVCGDGSCPTEQNPCVWMPDPGTCNLTIPRFYYDRNLQVCREFNYTGCGGNINNYGSLEECEAGTMVGACCHRTFSTDLDTLLQATQDIRTECQEVHLFECRAMHRQPSEGEEREVVSFQPRVACSEAGCLTGDVCFTVDRTYSVGDVFRLGCQNCTCLTGGQVDCTCVRKSRRRELRDMSREEVIRFQYAVSRLRVSEGESTWTKLRDLYMQHFMHANGGAFFLPWHRYFLRLVEQELQEIDCDITLPYFDFTTDVANFSNALLWQPNHFGGDGEGRHHCVPDHPFGAPSSWRPCLTRQFNTSVRLPTLVELSLALASEDYMEMSLCLETYLAYVHNFIGGDMATTGSPYDPAFFALHAFVDMLYWSWQQKDGNQFKFPAAFGNIPMIPFNSMPWMVFDLSALCVTYEYPSRGHECNTSQRTLPARPTIQRGDINPEVVYGNRGFDQFGYDKEGFDRLGFDRFGFDRDGYNRDGYNRTGFDETGFNRYDLDEEGYDRLGFDVRGRDRSGYLDTSGRFDASGYNVRCLNRRGLTRDGFDQYGFDVRGYDVDRCNYFFNGPFATLRSHHVFEIFGLQDKAFLMSLPRICPSLQPLPSHWLEQHWITSIKDVTGLVPVAETTEVTRLSSRFCFDLAPFLDLCPCREGLARCSQNPCTGARCPAFPQAQCRFSLCGECRPRWFHQGMEVDCQAERDFCEPNPCLHGGTCLPSIWPNEPSLVTCQCPPGFEGHHCQYSSVDTCSQPLITGNCGRQLRRWFYDHRTQSCREFVYTGCQGNANNFQSINACQARCLIGACCYRQPANRRLVIGYDRDGFDKYGFDIEGYSDLADRRTPSTALRSGAGRFNEDGYDWQGFDRAGYNKQGYDRYGYDRQGFDREGFNLIGYSRLGEYDGIIDYNQEGYDAEGFNRAGFDCHGVDRLGRNPFGVAAALTYVCRSMTFSKCQRFEEAEGVEVVRFTPGKRCRDVQCGNPCGCSYLNRTYRMHETFRTGCQSCTCTEGGVVVCVCDRPVRRKAVHDMSREELQKFQRAVQFLQMETGFPSQWFNFSALYASHKPQAVGSDSFLPWNRFFLHHVEQALREIDCDIFIPFYDWTLDVGQPTKAIIWAANMFGGNGLNLTECVEYHPFKTYYPPYWVPCLRRQFNSSISLPDAVTVQQAMNEADYSTFRIRMELFAKLFQTFVGGHMASDFSAYDPLYYSLMANIDKLWYEWQLKRNDAILMYPAEKRFLPLEPFKATPDDVLDSRMLLCVTYLPLSQGVPCNITHIRTHGFDEEGYDRHGYGREGFDRDGFNVIGVDAQGNVDQRGVYNSRGVDRTGFGRDGYDRSGFDRNGYYVDSYNLDGFDPHGFDRTGYDRHGFNRSDVTVFGFYRNGSFVRGVRESDLDIFDPYGYNKYGYDKYGFDRQGFDVFGFDKFGYNSQVCNYYYIGPMYVMMKHFIDEKLGQIDEDLLTKIRRNCPEISKIPDWQVVTNWLNRDNQIVLIDMIETQQNRRVQQINESITMQVGFRGEIDDRLCFVTQMFMECDLGVMPVLCVEDLCKGRTCPGHPTAVCRTSGCGHCHHQFYDGVTGNLINCTGCLDSQGRDRQSGETWRKSMCENCACVEGMVVCREVQCPEVNCPHPVKLDDQCCPKCDGCSFEGRVFASGAAFVSPSDPCSRCRCQRGEVRCQAVVCPALDGCLSVALPAGQCCPVCMDCGVHANASSWRPSPCQSCKCVNGRAVCEETICRAPNCDHPYTPDDDCCPVCVACFYQGRIYQEGEQFEPEACQTCQCRQGNVSCRRTPCPEVTCDRPVTPPGQCCPVCDSDCDYDMQRYRHNSVFRPSYNPCLNCSCINSMVRCSAVRCPPTDLPCARPARRRGECCPSYCATCSSGGREYQEGATWSPPGQPCVTCTCRGGSASCQRRDTCALECTHGVEQPGACCSPCTDCLFEGRVVPDGDTFLRPGRQCQQCTCRRGNIQCQMMGPCPLLPCSRTVPPAAGACCPTCLGCEIEGRSYKYGELVSQDKCSRCVCKEGQLDCQRVSCPQVRCASPLQVEGECCPVCRTCDYLGRSYQNGQTFTSPRDPCDMCTCQGGQVQCSNREADCPPTACSHPGRQTGRCCRRCDGCEYQRRSLGNGQKFMEPGGDPCQVCTCRDGSVTCSRMTCPEVNCLNPVTPAGHCCPVCESSCLVEGRQYEEGQTFLKPGDDCLECTCMNGHVGCQSRPCPPLPCSHPATLPGECCASCSFCLFDRRIFRHMQRFILPNDSCQECRCHEGSVLCERVSCPPLPCANPMPMAGQCCPVCPKRCTVGGLSYQDGEHFRSPRDSCQECLCVAGRVECQPKSCPQSQCQHPVTDDCCPMCDSCYFEGRVWKNGQTFRHADNRCRSCQCRNGTVTCSRLQCDVPTCNNPADDGCCPLCGDCSYGGRRYDNQQVFADPKNPCRTCVCEDGSVTCHDQRCPEVNCRFPVDDGCCKVCSDCSYGGVTFRQGQEFPDVNDLCGVCLCSSGNVTCSPAVCPPVLCSNPSMGTCCPECQDCNYDGQKVLEGESVSHTTDRCQSCHCRHGNMECQPLLCPSASCRHPVQRECCLECSDCNYGGLEHRNGAVFTSLEDECTECQCRNGNVECRPKICPPAPCSDPVRKGCCLECFDCLHEDSILQNGEQVPSPQDPCQACRCVQGSVICAPTQCPPAPCSHPLQGRCCPECGGDCDFQGRVYASGQTFEKDCQLCTCNQGNVRCQPKPCEPATCSHPVTESCCPVCSDCLVGNRLLQNDQSLPDLQDPCKECLCQDGSFTCRKRVCPQAVCTHPGRGRCCPECRNCLLDGRPLTHGQSVPDTQDPCGQCSCLFGNVTCRRKSCSPAPCRHPALDACGCPTCQNCSFQGRQLQSGQTLEHPSDGCQTCTCRGGSVDCFKRQCQAECRHPAGERDCCPDCSDCLFEGRVRPQGVSFTSDVDPCQECTCTAGTVTCLTVQCPPVQCAQPVLGKGDCCPSCPVCLYLGETYEDGTQFQHPEDACQVCTCKAGRVKCAKEQCLVSCLHPRQDICCPKCDDCFFEGSLLSNGEAFSPDPCRQCRCRDGNVVCQETQCPALDCLMKETPPDQCCPRCKGCNFRGMTKANGAMWILEENPCVSCSCVGGLVNCMETECLVPCLNPVQVPGQCCPVCPSCMFEGKTYSDGDVFSPNGDPCDTCTCVDGQLRCVHEACPSVAHCPPEQLVTPRSGECCPACSGFGTNCTRANLGETFRPQQNPCLSCQCKEDFNWVCMKDPCPMVTCPPDVQVTPPGHCCPQCPACYDSSEGRYHEEGETWTAADDPCVSCTCQADGIRCQAEDCPLLECGPMEKLSSHPGVCCQTCEPMPMVGCRYQGIDYEPGVEWVVDECTRCACVGGEVQCSVQRCDLADCGPDETLSTAPGACCPVCLKQPGTCIVFGDPHYRTFDGTTLHFQGMCKYVMAKDCENDTFEVEVQHDRRGAPVGVSWAQNFTVHVAGLSVDLLQNNSVRVNGEVVQLPYLRATDVYLEQSGNSVLLTTSIGVKLLWDGDSYAELSVPGSFKRKLCGLCGNFNGYPQDDLRTRYGQITNSPAVFGNTWKAESQYSEDCVDAQDIDPCITAGYRARKTAMAKCSILMGSDFLRCHRVVSPEPFLSSCVYDMCVCGDDSSCLCNILASYAHECAKAGVKVQWRKAGLCAIECAHEAGFVFDECGPVCPRTCENLHTPLGNLTENCFKPCAAGCQCPADKVVHAGRCIAPSQCPSLGTLAP